MSSFGNSDVWVLSLVVVCGNIWLSLLLARRPGNRARDGAVFTVVSGRARNAPNIRTNVERSFTSSQFSRVRFHWVDMGAGRPARRRVQSVRWDQLRPVAIRLFVLGTTPRSRATADGGSPAATRRRASRTFSSFSFAEAWRSPRPQLWRPF